MGKKQFEKESPKHEQGNLKVALSALCVNEWSKRKR